MYGNASAVSIHAPRVGRDCAAREWTYYVDGFNPRAPRGARPPKTSVPSSYTLFQSTRPAWGATDDATTDYSAFKFQSTRPAWGATADKGATTWDTAVSIHAPRVGRDATLSPTAAELQAFQSTRPAWGATKKHLTIDNEEGVSIHAPRVGRDARFPGNPLDIPRFNPRAPRGARHAVWGEQPKALNVSIHAPRVGRDPWLLPAWTWPSVSIHAPRVGRDTIHAGSHQTISQFQSTRPAWGAT